MADKAETGRDARRKAQEPRRPGIDEGPKREEMIADERQTERQADGEGGFGVPASGDR